MRRDFEDLNGADPWAVLGVARDTGAGELKRAYRSMAAKTHPDTGTGDEERFMRVKLAYDIVSQPNRAGDYADRLRRAAEPPVVDVEPVTYTDPFDWREGPGPGATSTTYLASTYEYSTEPSFAERIPTPPVWSTSQPGWNRLAIISLGMTFLCFPVSLFTGFAALSQIRATRERGAALAWTAIALAVAPILFFCAAQVG